MDFNVPSAQEKFAVIAEVMGESTEGLPVREAAYLAVDAVESLIEDCGVFTTLRELQVPEEDFPLRASQPALEPPHGALHLHRT